MTDKRLIINEREFDTSHIEDAGLKLHREFMCVCMTLTVSSGKYIPAYRSPFFNALKTMHIKGLFDPARALMDAEYAHVLCSCLLSRLLTSEDLINANDAKRFVWPLGLYEIKKVRHGGSTPLPLCECIVKMSDIVCKSESFSAPTGESDSEKGKSENEK